MAYDDLMNLKNGGEMRPFNIGDIISAKQHPLSTQSITTDRPEVGRDTKTGALKRTDVETTPMQELMAQPAMASVIDMGRSLATPKGADILGRLAGAIAPGTIAADVGKVGSSIAQEQMAEQDEDAFSKIINQVMGGIDTTGMPVEMQQQLFQNLFGVAQQQERERATGVSEELTERKVEVAEKEAISPETKLQHDLMKIHFSKEGKGRKPITTTREEDKPEGKFKVNYDYDYNAGKWTEASRSRITESKGEARAATKQIQLDVDKTMISHFTPIIKKQIEGMDEGEAKQRLMLILGGDKFASKIDRDRVLTSLSPEQRNIWKDLATEVESRLEAGESVNDIIKDIGFLEDVLDKEEAVDLFKKE